MQSKINDVFSNIDSYRTDMVCLLEGWFNLQRISNPAHNDFRGAVDKKGSNFAFIDSLEQEISNRNQNPQRILSGRREGGLNDLKNA